MSARQQQQLFDTFNKSVVLKQVEHMLTNGQDYIVQEINQFVIFKDIGSKNQVVNRNTKSLKFFDSFNDALNYCLDNLKHSKKVEQSCLF